MIVDLAFLGVFVWAAYVGTKRGLLLISCELVSFIVATGIALGLYQSLGNVIKSLAHVSISLGDVAAFIVIWIVIEVASALAVRYLVLPRLGHEARPQLFGQISGAVLNVAKSVIISAIAIIVFVGLPVPANVKNYVTGAIVPKLLLSSSGKLQTWLASGLGGDLSSSLNFYTVSSDPESTQRVELGYTTTGIVDPSAEAAMLTELNHERTSRSIPPLVLNKKARVVARAHSQDMFQNGYFSHINNARENPFDRMHAAGVRFGAAGENLALAPTLALAEQGLMNSPPHRANILDPSYRSVGIGIMNGGPYGLMVTQDFTDQD